MGQVGRWKEKIQDYMDSLKAQGYTKVQLVGQTDLDFILEHCAIKAGLEWEQGQELESRNDSITTLVLLVSNMDKVSRGERTMTLDEVLVDILKG